MSRKTMAKMPVLGTALMVSYVLLSPFYFWPSGLPQISDFVLLLLIGWSMTSTFENKMHKISFEIAPLFKQKYIVLLTLFVYYTLLVNLSWALIADEATSYLRSSTFLIFNLATMICFTYLYLRFRHHVVGVLYKSLSVSLWLQTVLSLIFMGTQVGRTVVFFNNPNQLGYYALLTAALLAVLYADRTHHNGIWRNSIYYLNLLACLVISAVSLSRAALLGTAFIVICSMLFESKGLKIRLRIHVGKLISISVLIIGLATLLKGPLMGLLDAWDQRVEQKGIVTGAGLSDRGYDRITDNPQYWVFGAGEGEWDRFDSVFRSAIELHSLMGNVFFSYGLIGASLLVGAVIIIVRQNPVSFIPFTGVLLYGLSHNGIRDGYLWILIGISGAATVATKSKLNEKRLNSRQS